MDFRKIEYFLKVAETMNISHAADQLNISHQGLSKQLHLLEEEIGTPLFEREKNKLRLTEAGKRMNEWFRPIISNAYYQYDKMLEFVQVKMATLHVGYFSALSYQRCVLPVIQYLCENNPELKVEILGTDIGSVKKGLRRDTLDLIITVMMDEEDWTTIPHAVLSTFPLKIIVSEKHPWFTRDEITEEDLKSSPMLYYSAGSSFFLKNLEVNELVDAYNYDSYMGMLESGNYFGIVADIYSRREGNYRLFDLPERCQKSASIIAAYRKEHPLSQMMESLKNLEL